VSAEVSAGGRCGLCGSCLILDTVSCTRSSSQPYAYGMAVCARPAVVLVGGTVPRCSCHSIMHQSSSDGRVHGRNLLFVDRLSHTFLLYLSIQVPTTEYRTYSMTFEENRSKDREWSGIRIAYIGTSRIVVTRRVTRNNKLSFLSEPTRSIFPPVKAKTRSAPTHPPTQKRNLIQPPPQINSKEREPSALQLR
jgi:hypothetical protein